MSGPHWEGQYSQIHCCPMWQPEPYSNASSWANAFYTKSARAALDGKFLTKGDWQISLCTTAGTPENRYVHIFSDSVDSYETIRGVLDRAGVPAEQTIEHAHWIPEPLTVKNLPRNFAEANITVHAFVRCRADHLETEGANPLTAGELATYEKMCAQWDEIVASLPEVVPEEIVPAAPLKRSLSDSNWMFVIVPAVMAAWLGPAVAAFLFDAPTWFAWAAVLWVPLSPGLALGVVDLLDRYIWSRG